MDRVSPEALADLFVDGQYIVRVDDGLATIAGPVGGEMTHTIYLDCNENFAVTVHTWPAPATVTDLESAALEYLANPNISD